ncbi:MAG: diaminopropionate ammonia-lyase [Gemmatimonadetes bacterium]|nr:diaminopropionate ammonia-lyase [Gemmatimonadota bacterium]MYG34537.1 diaminopropionate ammonia-lyase [Gemmatimonadota bacterium]
MPDCPPAATRSPRLPWTINPNAAPPGPCPRRPAAVIDLDAHRSARTEISSWPDYRPTPLRSAHHLASRLGLASVHVKDESGRFGLGSFKALGGAYGVLRVMMGGDTAAAPTGFTWRPGASGGDGHGPRRTPSAAPTVTCASDGNHGRSVAWGARMFGLNAVIYLPTHVTEVRAAAIRSFGARVVRVDGEYDDAVTQAARDARDNGWTVISDTSYPGYMEIPRLVMVGYTVMVEEALEALRASSATHQGPSPTHVFIQGGVGGLAAAVIGHLWERLGPERPVAVIVEPEEADGLYRSGCAGAPRVARGDLHTIMAGLSCREISPLAWEVVGAGAHAFMTVRDGGIRALMRAAAGGALGEPFEGGESGVAGLLGLIEAAGDADLCRAIGLGRESRVLVFNTEGATDPELYARIVGSGGGGADVPSA